MRTRLIKTDGLVQQVLEAGYDQPNAPLVLLIHGFPELGISWRAQVEALSLAGYHVAAPDMRGYGGTDKPQAPPPFRSCIWSGTWSIWCGPWANRAPSSWATTGRAGRLALRPAAADLFTAVAGLSVPFQPRRPQGPPTTVMAVLSERAGMGDLYINRFQAADAHRALEADPATTLRKLFWAYDGATPASKRATGFMARGVGLLDSIDDAADLPPWMSPAHFAEYVEAFSAGGFDAPLNWYRAIDLNWSLTAFAQEQRILQPALFIVGENDPVRHYAGSAEAG